MKKHRSKLLGKLRKKSNTANTHVIAAVLLLLALLLYTVYMSQQTKSVDPKSYQTLLGLIGKAESDNNYDAYFGNSANSKIKFTDMTIEQVLDWQSEFVANGNPSSAVGKYQFINTTLKQLVDHHNIDPSRQKFTPKTQDDLAISLIERRGSLEYVNENLDTKNFAANLAKEWASLPKTVGSDPNDSFYANDGLNKSRVKVDELLSAIEDIKPLNQ